MSDFSTNYSSTRTDRGLEAQVRDGVINKTKNIKKIKTADEMNKLGKDSFLKLLCAQMENQDPMQPQSNTEWVSQLATYSTLEQMQNLNATISNSQAYGLIGQEVVMATKGADGKETTVSGKVDFVSVKGNKAYLSIGGNMYPASDLQSVINPEFLKGATLPKVENKQLKFNKDHPGVVKFRVHMGEGIGKASALGLNIGGKDIPAKHFTVDEDGIVTVYPEAFKDFKPGTYKVDVKFKNDFNTRNNTNLTLTVTTGDEPKKPEPKKPEPKKPEGDKKAEEGKKTEGDKKAEESKKTEGDKKAEESKKPEGDKKAEEGKKPDEKKPSETPKTP